MEIIACDVCLGSFEFLKLNVLPGMEIYGGNLNFIS
jgi:hypothetical protein